MTAASFTFADYGQDGDPVNPCGDPPGGAGRRRAHDAADGRGRRAAQPGHPHDGPATRRASTARSCASIPRPAPACPATRSSVAATRTPAAIIADGSPQPLPLRPSGRARTRSGRATSAGTPGRRSTGSTRSSRRRRTSVALLRGRAADAGLRRAQPEHLREPLHRRSGAYGPILRLPARRPSSGETCAVGQLLDVRPGVLRGRRLPGDVQHGALFFADYSRDCIWVMFKGTQRSARPDQRAGVPDPRRQTRSTSRSARTATSSTSTSGHGRAAASVGSRYNGAATSRRPPWHRPTRRAARHR